MKKNRSAYIIGALFTLLFITACSDNDNGNNIPFNVEDGIPVIATLDTRAIPNELTCNLYVFWKPTSGSDYVFKQSASLTNSLLPYPMKFLTDDLVGKPYRFLFVATPTTNSKMDVLNDAGTELVVGDTWDKVVISTQEQTLDENYYYDILDKGGDDIIASGEIKGELERLVGQMVLDIYRIDGGINFPTPIVSNLVASVLDRVYQIDIEYLNLTKAISFDDNGDIVEKDSWTTPLKHSLMPQMGDTLQVNVPQVNGLAEYDSNVRGAVRVKGISGLTSSAKIKLKYTFKYYDTTPTCGIPAHEHNNVTGNCYPNQATCIFEVHAHRLSCFENNRRELTLHLPQNVEGTELLKILPNHYTVSKAGIKLDRIIDLSSNSSFVLETDWTNTNIDN